MNPFDIGKTYINISNIEVLFETYRMAIKRDKYEIEVLDYDAIKRNQIFVDLFQHIFSCLDGIYMNEKCLLIDTIKKDQFE